MTTGPTHAMLLDLCARLRLACEAINRDGGNVEPKDIQLADLALTERDRIRALAQDDLWALINDRHPLAKRSA